MSKLWLCVGAGDWLTLDRARVYSIILIAFGVLALAVLLIQSNGLVDHNGLPIGTDFASFYSAGSLVLDGRTLDVYNMAAHHARQQEMFGANAPYYAWFYPPIFLFVAAPLATLPYLVALAVWQLATLLLYLAVIRAIAQTFGYRWDSLKRSWLLCALAFPAVFVNLGHGQNGFLTMALFGGGLLILPRRPLLAGVLFGLLAYKPQFGLIIPVALVAGGYWRTVMSATATVAIIAAMAALVFGPATWPAFLDAARSSQEIVIEQGAVGFEKMQSVFAAVRLWGGGVEQAWVAQVWVSVAAVGSVAWIWRTAAPHDMKAGLLIIGALLASPHVLDYDFMILAAAIAFFVRQGLANGFRGYEISLLAMLWALPLFARGIAGATGAPVGFLGLAVFSIAAIVGATSIPAITTTGRNATRLA